MKPKKNSEKRIRRELEDNGEESERRGREGHTHADTPVRSQTRSAGFRRDLTIPRNLALAVRALSSHMLPRWNAELWTSQTNRSNPTQVRPPVQQVKRVGTKPPTRTSAARRQPTRCHIPLRPDLAQIKHLIKQDVTLREGRQVRPSTSRPVTPQSASGPSSSATVPYRASAEPSYTNTSKLVAQSVRCLQLCSSSSDSSPSPTDTLPYRRTTPCFRTRRYRNQLEWYKTLRSERKLRQNKKMLDQLYQKKGKSTRGTVSSVAAQADAPSGSQERRPADMDMTFQTTKRKRSPQSEQALTDVSCALRKTVRRSWRRQLDSSSSDSTSPPLSLHTSATAEGSRPAADPHIAPGPSGPSQCVEIDLFFTCSPAKTTPHKVSRSQRQGQNSGISGTEVSAGRVVGSPSTKTTPRQSTHSEKESQSSGVGSLKASTAVIKAMRKDIVSPLKISKNLCNEKGSQTPAISSSVTKVSGSTGVKPLSTKANIKNSSISSSSRDLKLKSKGVSCISQSLESSGAKPQTQKSKEKPLPDTPRPNRARDPGSFCKALLRPGRDCSVSTQESQFTSTSSSTSFQYLETQKKSIVKKKDKSSSSYSHKKSSASRGDSVKNNKCKKPSTTSGNVDTKNLIKKSKSLHGTAIEGLVSQARSDEKGLNVEQTQVSSTDKKKEIDSPSTSFPSGIGSTPEHKKEPWSKKKYLLGKAAMDTSVTVTVVNCTDSTSAGDAAVSPNQIKPSLAKETNLLTLSENTTSAPTHVLKQQSTNVLTLCETATPTTGCIINQEPTNPLMLSENTTSASALILNQPHPNSLMLCDNTTPTPALNTNRSQGPTNTLTPLVYQQPSQLLTWRDSTTLAPASMVNKGPNKPVALSEGLVSGPFSIFSLGPILPGPSWGAKPEYRFLRQAAKPKSKTCSAKCRNCFLKPNPTGLKSNNSQKNVTGISAVSTTTETTTSPSSSSSTTTTTSSVAEARGSTVEIQFSQPSAETPVSQPSVDTPVPLLGAPSKDAPQGWYSCHDYAAPSGLTPTRADTSQDSEAQGASDDHTSPLEDVPGPIPYEREREENAAYGPGDKTANVPAVILDHESEMRRSSPGQVHLPSSHLQLLTSQRRRVVTTLVRAVTSMLGLEIHPVAPASSTTGPRHQQPVLVHPQNIHAIQNPNPMHNSFLHGAGPPTSAAEQSPLHPVASQPPAAHSNEVSKEDENSLPESTE